MSKVISLRLTPEQAHCLYEIINMTGVALTEIDADFGSDSIETLAAKSLNVKNRTVSNAAHAIFNALDQVVGLESDGSEEPIKELEVYEVNADDVAHCMVKGGF